MKYEILMTSQPRKAFLSLPESVQKRIDRALLSLVSNPLPDGCVKLSGEDNLYRIRVGSYRILYQVRKKQLIILVVKIAHRREAYRK